MLVWKAVSVVVVVVEAEWRLRLVRVAVDHVAVLVELAWVEAKAGQYESSWCHGKATCGAELLGQWQGSSSIKGSLGQCPEFPFAGPQKTHSNCGCAPVKTKPAQKVFGQRNVNVTNRRLQTNFLPTQCKHLCLAKWRTGH
jgi:hypothetical protein